MRLDGLALARLISMQQFMQVIRVSRNSTTRRVEASFDFVTLALLGSLGLGLSGCGPSLLWSRSAPTAGELVCSDGQEPVAVMLDLDEARYGWVCGQPIRCATDREPVYVRTTPERGAAGRPRFRVEGQCVARCASDHERDAWGDCVRKESPEEREREERDRAEFWRKQNPARSCLQDCADEAKQCLRRCQSSGSYVRCAAATCQPALDACQPSCHSLGPR